MEQTQTDYQVLFKLSQHIRSLNSILSLLQWDQETYMPAGGSLNRARQVETMSAVIHDEQTGPAYTKALGKLVDLKTGELLSNGIKPEQQAALREWHRDWKRNKSLPSSFIRSFSNLTSQAVLVWRKAKTENNFQIFAPFLDKIVSMERQKADYLGWEEHPYDALVNLFEYDVTTKQLDTLFGQLKKPVHDLLHQINQKKQVKDNFLHARFSPEKQIEFARLMLSDMGYDFDKGRLDLSAHPFSTTIHPTDSRITTRLHPTWLMSNLLVVLHEGGHALYDMGLPLDSYGSPLGEPISLGMHECQSRFWETRIGQSKAYWKHYFPLLKKTFKGKFDGVTLDAFYKGLNKVHPSFIRVDADEVTYPLHVVLRFEMEKALIEGSMNVRDIPEAWNAKMKSLLEITPKNDREGCLQDIHWACGSFGYFPAYCLGTIYASHLFTALERDHPDYEKRIASGDLIFIKEWLAQNVYRHGRRYTSLDLLKKVTGKKLTSSAFVDYLNKKYTDIYKISGAHAER